MSRRTSTVSLMIGILATAVAMVAVVVLVQRNPGDLGNAVVVDRDRGSETAETGAAQPPPSGDSTAPADPRASDGSGAPGDPKVRGDRTSPGSATSGEPGASSVTGRERAERVKPPPPPRGGDDDDDDGGGDDD
ncbi:hypothetical protein OG339_03875 [Streptosporangium sp. NBC_01495]|uniref:hypothetical protein n=1 Tax=Streptosporangium sp. NBC_01495 TaxID=2903899 RepID=UPI002E345B2C|nr:hypothetical protein [Streptosporangium sp. NBC_01495]